VQYKELRGDIYIPFNTLPGSALNVNVEWPVFVVPWPMLLTAARFIPLANITANATNFFTLNVRNRGAAGAGTAIPASRSWAATNSTALVAEAMTLSATATDLQLAAGDVLTVAVVNSGAGLAVPVFSLQLTVRGR
jgi:hypothetical protein